MFVVCSRDMVPSSYSQHFDPEGRPFFVETNGNHGKMTTTPWISVFQTKPVGEKMDSDIGKTIINHPYGLMVHIYIYICIHMCIYVYGYIHQPFIMILGVVFVYHM